MKSQLTDKQWAAIRADYISGDMSLRELSVKYGVSKSAIVRQSTNGGWVAKRNQYRSKTEAKLAEKLADMQAADDALKLISLRRSADAMAGIIERTMNDTQQFNKYIISEGLGGGATQTECRILDKVDTKAIKDLTGAIKDLTTIMRNLYDLPTIQERAAMENAAARLKMDQQNAQKEESTGAVTVEFVGITDDLSN